jgi:glycosyltransferase involved in cell wall biosynthesis
VKIIGITRVRNESLIIKNTLDHVGKLVHGIIVYDDASTDDTVDICKCHPKVLKTIEGKVWGNTPALRNNAEGTLRQIPYDLAVRLGADWVYYFDADEYIDWEYVNFNRDIDTYFFRLFDFYITPEDIDKNYLERKWMGVEYRDIPMLFKVNPNIKFTGRVPQGLSPRKAIGGYVKHYGKAISVEEWDRTCEYYINYRWKTVDENLWNRWKNRVGKAIHDKSDFGTELITWDQRKDLTKIIKIG